MTSRSVVVLLFLAAPTLAADWPQFRGPDRTGVSKETGLLKAWPKEGPKLLWTYKEAGVGFSCPAIVGGTLYTMGGFDKDEYVLAIDMKGKKELWRAKVGPLFSYRNWGDGPRSTPTIAGDYLYALGGHGDLVCLDLKDKGKEKWRKSFAKDFAGEMMTEWGYSESVLIDGQHLVCTPGGEKGTLACLEKATGNEVWRSKGLKNTAPYSSIMAAEFAGVRQYIQNSYIGGKGGGWTSGIDAKTGAVLWSQQIFEGDSFAIAPTPIIKDNLVYVTSGYTHGCHCFDISKNGGSFQAKDRYLPRVQKQVKNTHGGVVLVGDHIYGHSEDSTWLCQNLETGEVKWDERNEHMCRSGSIVSADGMLYLLTDDGEVVLIGANPKEYTEVSSFKLPEKSALRAKLPTLRFAGIWTNPVIANGRLYLRDQELIFCFDIKK